jgi:hypothetical protein
MGASLSGLFQRKGPVYSYCTCVCARILDILILQGNAAAVSCRRSRDQLEVERACYIHLTAGVHRFRQIRQLHWGASVVERIAEKDLP